MRELPSLSYTAACLGRWLRLVFVFGAVLLVGCNRQPVGAPSTSTSAPPAQLAEPVQPSPAAATPSALQPSGGQPSSAQPAATQPSSAQSAATQPASVQPSAVQTALLAGGCFWGMEEILRKIPGVLQTEVGYAGGTTLSPRYESVSSGLTGHAETVRVVFDPQVLSYADLLEHWFFRMHDPTTKNRQGNDRGTQYRSAIFFTSPEQERVAKEVLARVDASKKWPAPVVTEVVAAGPFTPAEDYHQDYLQKNPGGYTCHYLRD